MNIQKLIIGGLMSLALVAGFSFAPKAMAEGAVVTQAAVDAEIVRRIYLGQTRQLIAANLPEGSDARNAFENNFVGRSPDQMKAHWSRLIFTGRAVELRVLESDEEVLEFVRGNANTVGYISDASKAGGLTVIATF
ncbi:MULTISPECIES: hypothetical protein [Gammaproteobacteria]|uniref:hypothetical protein n=1 Tax=Gammaproteobacteria TaxID=1236 RepID=UPI000DD0BF9D|nr:MULTISPECIES: hypothetical protein [Gammaproteobacteria]RTE86030.1 hypothetical protein DQX04_05515 [Aliidiomarina sp. B3213]TCZ91384.1 hypothetical protein EYQ95_05525 [Lysobacter sp. N42]